LRLEGFFTEEGKVMVSTSGAKLLPDDAVQALREELLPMATVLTPNLDEAILLLQDAGKKAERPTTVEQVLELAKSLLSLGPRHVLLKGGHLPLSEDGRISTAEGDHHIVMNVLCSHEQPVLKLESPFIRSSNTHGTGCSLACM
jgi:hydroxymethylpyrimidine kinase/phosphomethylpyrimidine kinase